MNNGRVLLQQSLVVGSENAFFTLKLDQLLVHQLDMALCGEINVNIFAQILSKKKSYLKNCVLVTNEWTVATRVDLHKDKMIIDHADNADDGMMMIK